MKKITGQNPDAPPEFIKEIEQERDRQVDLLVGIAEAILSEVPLLVAMKIKSIRPQWSDISIALAGSDTSLPSGDQ
jgi:hypothetical protein